jgi:protein-S-isoprenylcysteine O-methyltransferase Ste14
MSRTAGNVAYGVWFVVLLPALLVLWARRLDRVITDLPRVGSPTAGWILVAIGFACMAAGWWALVRYGEGLPMNVSPPGKMVTRGIYTILPHPIYAGFAVMAAGYFMATDLRPGFWIVTPCVVLGCTALVLGYERPDMNKRFGTADWPAALRLPAAEDASPSLSERASACVFSFLPWLALHEAVVLIGPTPGDPKSYQSIPFARPALDWTRVVYVLTCLFVFAAPLICRRKGDLRTFVQVGWLATAAGTLCLLLFPPATPSFPVVWVFLAAWLYARGFARRPFWYLLASMMAVSAAAAGGDSVLSLGGALGVSAVALSGPSLWRWALRTAERLANSWRQWRIGTARIIVHAAYSGAAACTGCLITCHLAGKEQVPYLLLIGGCVVVGAGIWGQFLKGKSKLARPFGFFGGVIGGTIGVLAASLLGGNGWLLAAAGGVATPFIQAVGRLRCLVQGCCHGRVCPPQQGIVVTQEHSRVVYLAKLGGQPIYPTPLYSILYNLVLGPLLLRAWMLSAPLPFIVGSCLILGGMGRFVEEAHRGEPQTPRFGGLAIYQWLALSGIAVGALLTTLPGPAYVKEVKLVPLAFVYAIGFGLLTALAMSVDFPETQRPLSRLAPP